VSSEDKGIRARAVTEASAVASQPAVSGVATAADGSPASASVIEPAGRRHRSFWRELPVLVVVALVIALVIKTFVVQAFFIPSSSMENTLKVGDKVLVNKLVFHFRKIEPGDVVVFNGAGSWDPVPAPVQPSSDPLVRLYDATLGRLLHSISGLFGTVPGQTDYIKRVIGVPGDRVACCTRGLVTVNGVPLHESSYLFPGAKPSMISFHMTVPPGRLWVMGDNRYVSDDSRLHTRDPGVGTIPESKVIGRAFLIVWPPGRFRVLPVPSTFAQPGVDRPGAASAASAASAGGAVAVAPSSPLLPLAAGFAGAVPVTWLSRRLRRRRRPGHR
jgi:signal peptidase I